MTIVSNWFFYGNTTHLSSIEKFSSHDIFYWCDTVDQDTWLKILAQYGKPKFVVGDNAGAIQIPGLDVYTVPFRGLELEWKNLQKNFVSFESISTDFCFNFQINKKQVNRHLLIKLLEYFKLDSFTYTWSGVDNCFDLKKICLEIDTDSIEWPSNFKSEILAPIRLSKRWIFHPQQIVNNVSVTNYGTNSWTWVNIFQSMMGSSAVSLISESQAYQLSSVFTEKTLYAVMALTFPIWIGGTGHADYFKSMGFDVFDDIIDHSYQHCPSLIRRCYHAMADNLSIISNLEYAQHMRLKHMDRLLANLDLLMYGNVLGDHVNKVVAQWPDELRLPIDSLWNRLRTS